MTSLIAAGGSGLSASIIPAVPAASSVTTIAFVRLTPLYSTAPTPAGRPANDAQTRYDLEATMTTDEHEDRLEWRCARSARRSETRPDRQPRRPGEVGRPHTSCPQRVDLLGALAEEGRNQESAHRATPR